MSANATVLTDQSMLMSRMDRLFYRLESLLSLLGGCVSLALVGQLFNPYVTTKEVGKGIGLGLSITWEIVQQQQGRLDFCNRAEGACFTLALPLVSEPLPATDHDGHAAA